MVTVTINYKEKEIIKNAGLQKLPEVGSVIFINGNTAEVFQIEHFLKIQDKEGKPELIEQITLFCDDRYK